MARFDTTYTGRDSGVGIELADSFRLFESLPLYDSPQRPGAQRGRARPEPKKLTRKIRNIFDAPTTAWTV